MIGIFDSGSGGLTVLSALRKKAPLADIIYFGDIKNAPYGNRGKEELERLMINNVRLLVSSGVTKIVSACNSLSSFITADALKDMGSEHVEFIEMVEPTVNYFRNKNRKILLVATSATIGSSIYQKSFKDIGISIDTKSIPELALSIERGDSEEEIEAIISKAFNTVDLRQFDTLILGCTHYPLVRNIFEKVCPTSLTIFDPAEPVSDKIIERFGSDGAGMIRFVISKDSEAFRKRVRDMGFVNSSIEII
jgi:glutamate racemase